MFDSKTYYDAAIAEVREHQSPGSATELQIQMLKDNPLAWEAALQEAIDELDSQLVVKREELEDEIGYVSDDEAEALEENFRQWKRKNRTFKKYIDKRLRYVQRLNGSTSDAATVDAPIDQEFAEEVATLALKAAKAENEDDADTADVHLNKILDLATERLNEV